jgi:hypothetical protein
VEAARYQVDAGTWRALALPAALVGDDDAPASLELLGATSGGEVLVLHRGRTWRYEADGDRWTAVDPRPSDSRTCATEAGFVLAEVTDTTTEPEASVADSLVAHRLGADGTWQALRTGLPDRPVALTTEVACTSTGVLVLGRSFVGEGTTTYALELDARTGSWREVDAPPRIVGQLASASVAGGAIVIGPRAQGEVTSFRYRSETGTWAPNPVDLHADPLTVRYDGVFVGRAAMAGEPRQGAFRAIDLL